MIRLRGNRIAVKLPKTEEKTDTGLYLPLEAREPPMEGIVLSVAPSMMDRIRPKDRVVFEQWAGLEYKDKDWGDVILLDADDLIMVVQWDGSKAITVSEDAHA